MIPPSLRAWIALSLGLHALLLVALGHTSLPGPGAESLASLVPIRFVAAPEPAPAARQPAPRPRAAIVPPGPKPAAPKPRPRPKPEPRAAVTVPRPKPVAAPRRPAAPADAAVTPGDPSGRRTGTATAPGRTAAGRSGAGPGPGGGLRRGTASVSPAPPAVMRAPGGRGAPAPPGIPGGTGTQGTGRESAPGATGGEPGGPTTGPVRLGGPVPGYPKLAEDAGAEGTVVVRVSLSASGEVESVSVTTSSGNASLDAAAVRAAHSWKFRPALRDGKPVAGAETLRFRFADGNVTGG
ncbi:MAG: energy transducer TonB [Armatimonadetes bacterium]|nr:energy transducer TonB [Armatimonadota bacterium]